VAIITISRGTMSGGMKLAQLLCDRLGYRCVSREIIVKAAERFGVPEEKLFAAVQKGPSLLQRLTFDRERYLAYIQEALCEEVKDDNVVYHGHAGHFLLPSITNVLKIRIVGDPKQRIEEAMQQNKLGEKDAAKYIEELDRQRIKWTHFLYGVDWSSPDLYDIVFNLKHIDLELVADVVAYTVQQPRFNTTAQTEKEVRDLLLSSKVRSALATLHTLPLESVVVESDEGEVILSGKTRTRELSDKIEDITRKVKGVKSVTNLLRVDYRYQGIDS